MCTADEESCRGRFPTQMTLDFPTQVTLDFAERNKARLTFAGNPALFDEAYHLAGDCDTRDCG